MKFTQTALPDVIVIEPDLFTDDRGWLAVHFDEPRFHSALRARGLAVPGPFVQENQSMSKAGVLRGLHYQLPPHAQGKLVRVLRGAVFDVAVDMRRASPTFGAWVGMDLSADNGLQAWIPEGFAHGFIALTDDTHVLYKATAVYATSCERSLAWDDASIGIRWPSVPNHAPVLSAKDRAAPRFADADFFG